MRRLHAQLPAGTTLVGPAPQREGGPWRIPPGIERKRHDPGTRASRDQGVRAADASLYATITEVWVRVNGNWVKLRETAVRPGRDHDRGGAHERPAGSALSTSRRVVVMAEHHLCGPGRGEGRLAVGHGGERDVDVRRVVRAQARSGSGLTPPSAPRAAPHDRGPPGVPVRAGPDPGAGRRAAVALRRAAVCVQLGPGPGQGEPRAAGG